MTQKWYRSRMNQAALITGAAILGGALLSSLLFRPWARENDPAPKAGAAEATAPRIKPIPIPSTTEQIPEVGRPRLWITYAFEDDAKGDFSYLVQELRASGIDAVYDRLAVVPGRDLWAQLGEQITDGPYDGWAYLITPNSLASEACREQLAYALSRALRTKGRLYPLIGLLHGVRLDDLPPPLRVRLSVSLRSPTWKEEVKAALEGRPAQQTNPVTQFVWVVHPIYDGAANRKAIEIRPRFGEVMYWRIAVPSSSPPVLWGHGPAGGGRLSITKTMAFDGSGTLNNSSVIWFGSGDRLSPSVSAYAIFEGSLPSMIAFGVASGPTGVPEKWEAMAIR